MTADERKLLERLAGEGKTTVLTLGEIQIAKSLEADGLVFLVRDSRNAIITAKGRHLLTDIARPPKPPKPPSSLLE